MRGTRWRSWLRHCATCRKVAGSIPDGVIAIFHLTQSFRPQYGPGVDSASNRNEYQEYFLGGKGGFHVPIVLLLRSYIDRAVTTTIFTIVLYSYTDDTCTTYALIIKITVLLLYIYTDICSSTVFLYWQYQYRERRLILTISVLIT